MYLLDVRSIVTSQNFNDLDKLADAADRMWETSTHLWASRPTQPQRITLSLTEWWNVFIDNSRLAQPAQTGLKNYPHGLVRNKIFLESWPWLITCRTHLRPNTAHIRIILTTTCFTSCKTRHTFPESNAEDLALSTTSCTARPPRPTFKTADQRGGRQCLSKGARRFRQKSTRTQHSRQPANSSSVIHTIDHCAISIEQAGFTQLISLSQWMDVKLSIMEKTTERFENKTRFRDRRGAFGEEQAPWGTQPRCFKGIRTHQWPIATTGELGIGWQAHCLRSGCANFTGVFYLKVPM